MRAVLDACAIVPIIGADTLLRFAEVGLYTPLWSKRILFETVYALERIHPDMQASGVAHRRVMLMNKAFTDASVETPQELIESLSLPDPDDRHVLATAIEGDASFIITNNLKDFPTTALTQFKI